MRNAQQSKYHDFFLMGFGHKFAGLYLEQIGVSNDLWLHERATSIFSMEMDSYHLY